MNIIILIVATYPVTIAINAALIGSALKDAASNGQVVNKDQAREESKKETPKCAKIYFLTQLVPFLNIASSGLMFTIYMSKRFSVINSLNKDNFFKSMTIEEQKKFEDNPTGYNAIKINSDRAIEEEFSTFLDLSVINEEGKIYYILQDDKIKILGGEGFGNLLTTEKKKEIIENFVINKEINQENNTSEKEEEKQTEQTRTRKKFYE